MLVTLVLARTQVKGNMAHSPSHLQGGPGDSSGEVRSMPSGILEIAVATELQGNIAEMQKTLTEHQTVLLKACEERRVSFEHFQDVQKQLRVSLQALTGKTGHADHLPEGSTILLAQQREVQEKMLQMSEYSTALNQHCKDLEVTSKRLQADVATHTARLVAVKEGSIASATHAQSGAGQKERAASAGTSAGVTAEAACYELEIKVWGLTQQHATESKRLEAISKQVSTEALKLQRIREQFAGYQQEAEDSSRAIVAKHRQALEEIRFVEASRDGAARALHALQARLQQVHTEHASTVSNFERKRQGMEDNLQLLAKECCQTETLVEQQRDRLTDYDATTSVFAAAGHGMGMVGTKPQMPPMPQMHQHQHPNQNKNQYDMMQRLQTLLDSESTVLDLGSSKAFCADILACVDRITEQTPGRMMNVARTFRLTIHCLYRVSVKQLFKMTKNLDATQTGLRAKDSELQSLRTHNVSISVDATDIQQQITSLRSIMQGKIAALDSNNTSLQCENEQLKTEMRKTQGVTRVVNAAQHRLQQVRQLPHSKPAFSTQHSLQHSTPHQASRHPLQHQYSTPVQASHRPHQHFAQPHQQHTGHAHEQLPETPIVHVQEEDSRLGPNLDNVQHVHGLLVQMADTHENTIEGLMSSVVFSAKKLRQLSTSTPVSRAAGDRNSLFSEPDTVTELE